MTNEEEIKEDEKTFEEEFEEQLKDIENYDYKNNPAERNGSLSITQFGLARYRYLKSEYPELLQEMTDNGTLGKHLADIVRETFYAYETLQNEIAKEWFGKPFLCLSSDDFLLGVQQKNQVSSAARELIFDEYIYT